MGIRHCFKNRLFLFLMLMSLGLFVVNEVHAKNFLLVIDPGHGGKDPGAMGHHINEKEINLKVALQLGKLIKRNMKDVDIIYTRNKDYFVTLKGRAQMANKAKADLFISIHTNSSASRHQPSGASTWSLRLGRFQDNLDIAKRENSVISLEGGDYKKKYYSSDKSTDSDIINDIVQNKKKGEVSVHFSKLIQKQLTGYCGRKNRGARQAGFLVLREVLMPSVLVEVGFVSNPREELYLRSTRGQYTLASGIYRAFKEYKTEVDKRKEATALGRTSSRFTSLIAVPSRAVSSRGTSSRVIRGHSNRSQIQNKNSKEKTIFKVQILSSGRRIAISSRQFRGLTRVGYYKSGIYYRYTCGDSENYNAVYRLRCSLLKRFPGCFVIADQGEKHIDIHAAINQFRNK